MTVLLMSCEKINWQVSHGISCFSGPFFSGTLQDQSNKFWGQRGSEKLGDFSLIPLGSSNVAGKSSNS